MRSPISPVLANIVMQNLETCCLNKIDFDIPLYFRYIDDILALVPEDKINYIIDIFNAYHLRSKFTYEMEKEN